MTTTTATRERADLLETLRLHRGFLRYTVRNLTDEQVTKRTTVSELTLAGLIKHVTAVEQSWTAFIVEGPSEMNGRSEDEWAAEFRMSEGETLAGLLDAYEQTTNKTDEILTALPDLDAAQPLPEAPWFEPGASWSARRVLLHLIAETSQHAGHADIIREALDGQKTMG